MFKCDYCDRELKSKAGLVRHMSSCKSKVVKLEVIGSGNYYVGHPRRLIKLKGMMTKTFDKSEKAKIQTMIMELINGSN